MALFELLRDAWQLRRPEAQDLLIGPMAAIMGDNEEDVRKAAVQFWHSILPQSLPARLLVRIDDVE